MSNSSIPALVHKVYLFEINKKWDAPDYPVISPYAIRSALREILIVEELPSNRSRINDGGAPKVEFKDFPNPDLYADDFLFGFCVTDRAAVAAHPDRASRRDSVLRNNMAVALSSNIDVHLQIAPRNTENSPWNNIKETSLLYRQVSYTAYQYPFALTLTDCLPQPKWMTGEDNRHRYGLPFAGDNNYLFDRIDCLDEPIPSHWFVSLDSNLEQEPGAVSLTVEIDRHAPSKTKSMLFSATKDSLTSIPDRDWLSIYEIRGR